MYLCRSCRSRPQLANSRAPRAPAQRARRRLAAYGRAVEGKRAAQLRREAACAAQHDPLTGLPNRARLSDCLDELIGASRQWATPFGLLLLDLDRFKEINETLGHKVGDQVLRHVARRLRDTAPGEATVARLGGDEFAVLLPNSGTQAAATAGERFVDVLRVPMLIDDQEVAFDVSISVVVYPHHGENSGTLLRHAELAMYAAKQSRAGCMLYSADQDEEARERLALASALRGAVMRNELVLDYQPKVDCGSERTVGVEALLRWEHAELGRVDPVRSIPLAEQTGLIGQLTRWVLGAALRQCREWLNVGLDISVAVNISALDAQDTSVPDTLRDMLAHWDEDEPTLGLLRILGCDHVQGYLVGRPMPAAELEAWLRSADDRLAA